MSRRASSSSRRRRRRRAQWLQRRPLRRSLPVHTNMRRVRCCLTRSSLIRPPRRPCEACSATPTGRRVAEGRLQRRRLRPHWTTATPMRRSGTSATDWPRGPSRRRTRHRGPGCSRSCCRCQLLRLARVPDLSHRSGTAKTPVGKAVRNRLSDNRHERRAATPAMRRRQVILDRLLLLQPLLSLLRLPRLPLLDLYEPRRRRLNNGHSHSRTVQPSRPTLPQWTQPLPSHRHRRTRNGSLGGQHTTRTLPPGLPAARSMPWPAPLPPLASALASLGHRKRARRTSSAFGAPKARWSS